MMLPQLSLLCLALFNWKALKDIILVNQLLRSLSRCGEDISHSDSQYSHVKNQAEYSVKYPNIRKSFFFFFFDCMMQLMELPQPGIEPTPLKWKCCLNHWATREAPGKVFYVLACFSEKLVILSSFRQCKCVVNRISLFSLPSSKLRSKFATQPFL